jgi:hypothetical protein
MSEQKKVAAVCLYILLSACMGLSRHYVEMYNVNVPSYVYLYAHGACIFPLILYQMNFKSKWFLFIFTQLFSLVYVYIFSSKNTIYFFTSLIDFSNIVLRYNLFWKYIVYNTLTLDETKNFHIYASASYIAYHMDSQIKNWIPIHNDILIYICCPLYIIIGIVVYFLYVVEEKHVLMYDKISIKRMMLKGSIIYFSTCNFLNILSNFKTEYTHYAAIIASCFVLTLNGKLLQIFDYTKLNHVSGFITLFAYLAMKYLNFNRDFIMSICLQIVIGTKFIVFDTVHQVLHITHKKNIIDQYIGLEIIAMSNAYVTIYFLPQFLQVYFFILCVVLQLVAERLVIKYYKKDVDFLTCIAQLDSF